MHPSIARAAAQTPHRDTPTIPQPGVNRRYRDLLLYSQLGRIELPRQRRGSGGVDRTIDHGRKQWLAGASPLPGEGADRHLGIAVIFGIAQAGGPLQGITTVPRVHLGASGFTRYGQDSGYGNHHKTNQATKPGWAHTLASHASRSRSGGTTTAPEAPDPAAMDAGCGLTGWGGPSGVPNAICRHAGVTEGELPWAARR